MRRRRSALAMVAAIALIAIPAVAVPVGAAGTTLSRHDQIVAYWTPARMRAAVPRDFVLDRSSFVPRGKPGAGGGVTGASWTKGGDVLRQTGKVYFVMGLSGYVCSGSVVDDTRTDKSLVLTAGHCAFDEARGAFATDWLFIPDFDGSPTFACGSTTYGCWTAEALVVDNGYASAGGFNTQATLHDFAFAVVGNTGHGATNLDVTVGSFPIAFSEDYRGVSLHAFGYPAAGKYHGNDLTYCAGTVFTDSLNSDRTWAMACGMTGGSSGGPWLSRFNEATGDGTLSSLNSYGYSGVRNMYGPKFNTDTQSVYAAAGTADATTGNVIVP